MMIGLTLLTAQWKKSLDKVEKTEKEWTGMCLRGTGSGGGDRGGGEGGVAAGQVEASRVEMAWMSRAD